jgi:glycosyltransferase involved in cell wall biosynthesis
MRICLVYDCLYPYTVGGAERWYRSLGERLAAAGHDVTYLTLRQWERDGEPRIAGVDVKAVGPRMRLYDGSGGRRIMPPLVFGLGVLLHLLKHGRRYDAVHTASFPYFSVLAAALTRRRGKYALLVDWFEVWTLNYWTAYLGRLAGPVGWLVQLACIRVRQQVFCFSRLHAERIARLGLRGEVTVLAGVYTGPRELRPGAPADPPMAVFAGRHIPDKQVSALIPAIATAREQIPDLRARIIGDGPERPKVIAAVEAAGLGEVIQLPGFIPAPDVELALAQATCMVLPSRREGYGLVVVEAASHGTPSVVVRAADNAATELIAEGENGYVAPSAGAHDLAAAIVAVHREGQQLRGSTARWFTENVERLSIDASLDTVVAAYGRPTD